MGDTRLPVTEDDSLWAMAQNCGIPGGGSNWQALDVERNGTVYDLATQDLPGGLRPGDTVIVPEELDHSCQGEVDEISSGLSGTPQTATPQGAAAQAAATAQPAGPVAARANCSATIVFVLDPGHGGRGARANLADAARLRPYTEALAAGTLSQTDYDLMFDVQSSSWNNSLGAVTNTLEKTMTHRLIPLVRDKIDAMKGEIIARLAYLTDVEVHLTKTDEYVNMTGADRAAVARDKSADFFFCCHFNSLATTDYVYLDITQVSGTVDRNRRVNASSLDPGLTGGTYPKRASSSAGRRGPLILYSGHSNSPPDTVSRARMVGAAIRTDLTAALQLAEGSADTMADQGDKSDRLANISPIHLGTTDPANKQVVPIYLEADFINTESGDRLWNTTAYNAEIDASRTRWGIPPKPSGGAALQAWKTAHLRRADMPDLPASHDMFDAAAESIATSLLANMNQRIC